MHEFVFDLASLKKEELSTMLPLIVTFEHKIHIFLIILLILVIGILIYLNSSDIYKNDLIVSPVEENDEFTSEEKFDAVSQSLTKQIQYKNINSFHN